MFGGDALLVGVERVAARLEQRGVLARGTRECRRQPSAARLSPVSSAILDAESTQYSAWRKVTGTVPEKLPG